jgi:D-hydroxyproline dehydrogenase subunit gamma
MNPSRFRTLAESPRVRITLDGSPLDVPAGASLAAALLAAGVEHTRTTPVSGAPRAPYCMMGVCFDCLVEIDGHPNRQACLTPVQAGMQVRTQQGARALGTAGREGSHDA